MRTWDSLTAANREKLTFIGKFFAVIVMAAWTFYTFQPPDKPVEVLDLIKAGNGFLNIGRYDSAKQRFQQALDINKQNKAAAWGLEKARLWDIQDKAIFQQSLRNLYDQKRCDPHLNLFYGKWYGAEHNAAKALTYYQKALDANPDLAEAYFDQGVLYDQLGQSSAALAAYKKAADLGTAPKYQNNLAYEYFKQKNYQQAAIEYGKISNFPLSALELAKLNWINNDLPQAETNQRTALRLLNDTESMTRVENQDPWYFADGHHGFIELMTPAEKNAYAQVCLSASLFFQGEYEAAKLAVAQLAEHRPIEVKRIITADLHELVQANAHISPQVEAYLAWLSAR